MRRWVTLWKSGEDYTATQEAVWGPWECNTQGTVSSQRPASTFTVSIIEAMEFPFQIKALSSRPKGFLNSRLV